MTTETATAAPAPHLLINGTVHSTTEPYAESLLVKDGLVAWVGDEDTARRGTDDTVQVRDLDRALVSPAFIGWVDSPVLDGTEPVDSRPALDEAVSLGYGAVRLGLTISRESFLSLRVNTPEGEQVFDRYDAPAVVEQLLQQILTEVREHPLPVFPHLHVTHMGGIDLEDPRSASFLTEVVQMMRILDEAAGAPLALAVGAEDLFAGRSADEAEEILLEIRRTASGAHRQLIIDGADAAGTAATGERAALLVDAVVSSHERLRHEKMTPAPSTPTVLSGFDATDRQLWERLLNTGVHVIFRAAGHLATALSVGLPSSAAPQQGRSPWELISEHVHHDEDPVSVRAGFNAQVRGAYRSLIGGASGAATGGQLNPGAAATYAVWQVDSLAVQTPDSRTAAWSTDVRARTPLLPYLDGESFPQLVHTVVDGATLFSRDAE